MTPKALLLNSWGQWVNPILDLKASILLCLFIRLYLDRGTMQTVMESLTKLLRLASIKAWLGSLIFPPCIVRESNKIKSPALHSINLPVPTNGSLCLSSTQSDGLCLTPVYLSASYNWVLSLFVLGTSWSPPAPSLVTSMKGTMPWTQWNPFLKTGFWSMWRF